MRQSPVWAEAIQRLMSIRGYRTQAALIAAAHKRGIRLRPNTVSDALSPTQTTGPRLDTLAAIAQALEVPLWALCCEGREYHLFMATLETQSQQRTDVQRVLDELDRIRQSVQEIRQHADEHDAASAVPLKKRHTA
jgi:transcriptional regulator with XRE-family HTH domain